MFFVQTPHKTAILSEAPHGLPGDTALDGAGSKDPEGAYLTHAARSFSTTEARSWRIRAEKTTQRLAAGKNLNLIRTMNPEFKDLAQTWGRKVITGHEKICP
jgi:hypothetical protein